MIGPSWDELLIVRGSGRVRTGSAQFRRPTRIAAADAVQPRDNERRPLTLPDGSSFASRCAVVSTRQVRLPRDTPIGKRHYFGDDFCVGGPQIVTIHAEERHHGEKADTLVAVPVQMVPHEAENRRRPPSGDVRSFFFRQLSEGVAIFLGARRPAGLSKGHFFGHTGYVSHQCYGSAGRVCSRRRPIDDVPPRLNAGAGQSPPAQPQRPNVVLIITDDVGYGDFGSYGAPDIKTPNIDRLAKEGVQADRFLRGAPVHADARRAHHRALSAARAPRASPRQRGRRARSRASRRPAVRCRSC